MISRRTKRTGRVRPVRIFWSGAITAITLSLAPLPLAEYQSLAQPAVSERASAGQEIPDFYRSRNFQPLWLGRPGRQVEILLELLDSAPLDGLERDKSRISRLERAVDAARSGNRAAVRKADVMLSDAFVSYVREMRKPADVGMIYVDAGLRPTPPKPRFILEAAARAPSLEDYVANMRWMHPVYAQLRRSLARGDHPTRSERQRIMLNLERARELPVPTGRHVLVNSAAQTLYMYDGDRVVGSMRVVVGKPRQPTPMMAALIRYTSLNPYWNVPPDLAAERIAPFVVKAGPRYLREKGYQLLSDWTDSAHVIDPRTIDWEAVAAGRQEVRIRQLPGPQNSMGQMKFMFPNAEGVYLHDTPERELLSEASRLFSGGCVRLEDAPRLAEWLHGKPLRPKGAKPEQKVPLDQPVPVYLTYLTAVPDESSVAFFDDIYGRDAQRLAQLQGNSLMAPSR